MPKRQRPIGLERDQQKRNFLIAYVGLNVMYRPPFISAVLACTVGLAYTIDVKASLYM